MGYDILETAKKRLNNVLGRLESFIRMKSEESSVLRSRVQKLEEQNSSLRFDMQALLRMQNQLNDFPVVLQNVNHEHNVHSEYKAQHDIDEKALKRRKKMEVVNG